MPKHPRKKEKGYATKKSPNSISRPGKYANKKKSGNTSPKSYDPDNSGEFGGGSAKVSQMYSQPSDE